MSARVQVCDGEGGQRGHALQRKARGPVVGDVPRALGVLGRVLRLKADEHDIHGAHIPLNADGEADECGVQPT